MSEKYNKFKILLVILDGWAHSSKYHGNAIKQACTPTLDFLWHNHPKTLLNASENHVGLPMQQMGNSEVGHTTIGAGRTINQALVRISKSIQKGIFFNNVIINEIYQRISKQNKQMHLIGLCSDGGVHSHIQHLIALIKIAQCYKNVNTCIHIITDGRDTEQQSAIRFISLIIRHIKNYPNIEIHTISGRYYSMDRDCRWGRTMKAYECLTENNPSAKHSSDIIKVIRDHYAKDIYDEFIIPTRVREGNMQNQDGAICFNFRPDRMRQLAQALCSITFKGFKRKKMLKLDMVTFTGYDSRLDLPVVFSKIANSNFLGQAISDKGFKQFRLAETEKYAHVTYFFNGGREEPFPGEDRELIASPRVDTYDLKPEMSASQITNKLIEVTKEDGYKLIVVNYANADMIGHTGQIKATKVAVETVDNCINKLLTNIKDENQEMKIIITADHGNADVMLDQDNKLFKTHTKNLVPFIIVDPKNYLSKAPNKRISLMEYGSLADIAPTILELLEINKPSEMEGKSLIMQQ